MKLPWLKSALEQEGPFLSIYFDTTRADETAASDIANRWSRLKDTLLAEGASKKLLAEIEDSILRPSSIGGRHGRAIIASDGEIIIDRVLPAPPSEDAGHYGDKPLLLPLMRLTPHAIRQLLIEVDRSGADLHLRSATDPSLAKSSEDLGTAASVEGGHDELHKTSSGGGNQHGWRADNFQARVEDSWERNAEAVADQVNKLVLEHQPEMVLLAGDVRAQALLKAELRQEVTERLWEIPGGTRGQSLQRESFRTELKKATEQFAADKQRALADQFRESQARDTASVGGAAKVSEALERGQVDELLFVPGQEPADIEELLFQAITTDAGVDALDTGLADLLDGVGALLRWKDDATPPAGEEASLSQ